MAKHEPLNQNPDLMSAEKRAWWAQRWPGRSPKQPRLVVFQFAMNSTMRPTAPDETIAMGYMGLEKFHDREPGLVLAAIEEQDPSFFDTYPRRKKDHTDEEWVKAKCAIIGHAARAFYRHGRPSYGKPGLRKDSSTQAPLVAL